MSRTIARTSSFRIADALGASRNQILARDLAVSAPTIAGDWTGGDVSEAEGVGLVERDRLFINFPNRSGSTSIGAGRSARWSRAMR